MSYKNAIIIKSFKINKANTDFLFKLRETKLQKM